jgi:hypothetical protein
MALQSKDKMPTSARSGEPTSRHGGKALKERIDLHGGVLVPLQENSLGSGRPGSKLR